MSAFHSNCWKYDIYTVSPKWYKSFVWETDTNLSCHSLKTSLIRFLSQTHYNSIWSQQLTVHWRGKLWLWINKNNSKLSYEFRRLNIWIMDHFYYVFGSFFEPWKPQSSFICMILKRRKFFDKKNHLRAPQKNESEIEKMTYLKGMSWTIPFKYKPKAVREKQLV